jgi:hypothetical protein
MLTLTPLSQIDAFTPALREQLAPYWLTSAEEFVTTAQAANRQYGSGLAALAVVLGISEDAVRALVDACQTVLPAERTFGTGPRRQVDLGTGAVLEGMDMPEAVAFDLPHVLPPEINLTDTLDPPQQQGKRDTCLAFTLVSMYQHTSGDLSDLSEQFLYWACKERDGIPDVPGTRPDVALRVLQEMGVCAESTWPYQPQPIPGDQGQGPPPPMALSEARLRRISSFSSLPARGVRHLQYELKEGKVVLIGLPIFEHWLDTWQARTLGRVRKPLPGESERGGHAMTVMGYRDDASAPGQGYFIVRNSWGTGWGTQNPDGPGYCHIPYQLIADQNLVACVIDGIVQSPDAPELLELPRRSQIESTTAVVGREPLNDAAAAPISERATRAEVRALYEETRAIRDRLNTVVERLAALTQRIGGG